MAFIHLRTRTAYSLLEGALRMERLPAFCREHNSPALAITDRANLFGALEFSETLASKGIQPIIGVCLPVNPRLPSNGLQASSQNYRQPHVVLLSKNLTGYQNLLKLVSRVHLRSGQQNQDDNVHSSAILEPCASLDDLRTFAEGLICLTGGSEGILEHYLIPGQDGRARDILRQLKEIFSDRLYVELQRHNLEHERRYEAGQVNLAYELELPLVATNDARFHERQDFSAYDVLCCIEQGALLEHEGRRSATEEHFLKPPQEMQQLFKDLPEAVANSEEIARRCSWRPVSRDAILPRFPDAGDGEAEELRKQARLGLHERLKRIEPAASRQEYEDRLERELDVVVNMNYAGYFLVVADFIKWARNKQIPVGPGRGSGAGSLVAYALTITDIDPLRFGLLFERFLNSERISMPDFDIDFCPDRREQVIRYVCDKYGDDRVAQITTFGTLQARAVLRDVARVLGVPLREVDRLCKLVPYQPANPVTLEAALRDIPELSDARKKDERVDRMMEIAMQLEGLYRHASTHAAGLVISDHPLDELVPLYRDPRSEIPVTQFSMKWVERAGLIKFDFLGLKTLSIIDRAISQCGISKEFPLDDGETFAMLCRGDTMGVFQVEGAGMRDTLQRMGADRIEDIVALIALYRPGPMDNIPQYIKRKHGQEKPDYIHDLLRPVLEETYGVIVYQEQVMQIAQILADYSPNEADLLRRAMGKKERKEMEQQKQRFVNGVVEKGVSRMRAADIFELVNKFAGYGFNKSHAAAYALLVYQTAYLKAHHPAHFLAACMSWDLNNPERLRALREEGERMNISLLPPCVNHSGEEFQVNENGAINYALSAVRNVGRRAAGQIAEERKRGGKYRDVFDFTRRLAQYQIPRRAMEYLVRSGAFDDLEPNRNRIFLELDRLIGIATRVNNEQEDSQDSLFGGGGEAMLEDAPLADAPMWSDMELLGHEYDAVGFHLSGHPMDPYREALGRAGVYSLRAAKEKNRHTAYLAGVLTGIKERKSSKGNRYAFLSMSDPTSEFECLVFSEMLSQCRSLLESGKLLVVQVEIQQDNEAADGRLRVSSLEELESFLAKQSPIKPAGKSVQKREVVPSPSASVPVPASVQQKKDLSPTASVKYVPAATVIEIRVQVPEALALLHQSLEAVRRKNGEQGGEEVVLILRGAGVSRGDARLRLAGRFSLGDNLCNRLSALAGVESVTPAVVASGTEQFS